MQFKSIFFQRAVLKRVHSLNNVIRELASLLVEIWYEKSHYHNEVPDGII